MCNLQRLRLGEEKKKEERKKPQGKNMVVFPIPYGDHNKAVNLQCVLSVFEA